MEENVYLDKLAKKGYQTDGNQTSHIEKYDGSGTGRVVT